MDHQPFGIDYDLYADHARIVAGVVRGTGKGAEQVTPA